MTDYLHHYNVVIDPEQGARLPDGSWAQDVTLVPRRARYRRSPPGRAHALTRAGTRAGIRAARRGRARRPNNHPATEGEDAR